MSNENLGISPISWGKRAFLCFLCRFGVRQIGRTVRPNYFGQVDRTVRPNLFGSVVHYYELFHPQTIPVAEPVPVSYHVPYTVPIPDFFAFLFLYLFSL